MTTMIIPTIGVTKDMNGRMTPLVAECVKGIVENTLGEYKIIIVLNDRKGYSKPVNEGIRMANDDCFIFNDDYVVKEKGWNKKMIDVYEANKDVCGCVCSNSFNLIYLPRKTQELIGLFDENIFFMGEDTDYRERLDKLGLDMIECKIDSDHHGSATSGTFGNLEEIKQTTAKYYAKKKARWK